LRFLPQPLPLSSSGLALPLAVPAGRASGSHRPRGRPLATSIDASGRGRGQRGRGRMAMHTHTDTLPLHSRPGNTDRRRRVQRFDPTSRARPRPSPLGPPTSAASLFPHPPSDIAASSARSERCPPTLTRRKARRRDLSGSRRPARPTYWVWRTPRTHPLRTWAARTPGMEQQCPRPREPTAGPMATDPSPPAPAPPAPMDVEPHLAGSALGSKPPSSPRGGPPQPLRDVVSSHALVCTPRRGHPGRMGMPPNPGVSPALGAPICQRGPARRLPGRRTTFA